VSQNQSIRLYVDVVYAYSRGILRGVADYAKVHGGWDINFSSTIPPDFATALVRDNVKGVIVKLRRQDQADKFRSIGVAAVNVSNLLSPFGGLPAVFNDDFAVGKMAAEYYLGRGFRNFAYFGIAGHRYSQLRGQGFMQGIERAGFKCFAVPRNDDGEAMQDISSLENERTKRLGLLNSLPHPLAVFCCNDSRAKELIRDATRLGLRIPDQIAVLGVDNDEIHCELSGVPLSSVQIRPEQVGYEAAALLDKLMAGESAPSEPIVIPPMEVITRRSTDVLPLNDAEVAAAVRFIRDRGGREINVEDLLARTSLSRRSLEMRFRKALGRSPYQEIRRVQIERAKVLLSRTDRPVREIADACGFKETRQLSMAFHDRIGLTPRQYRRRNRQHVPGSPDGAPAPGQDMEIQKSE
jgi:LacI family transcriptional regulator